jgi:hypothetical protein
MYRHIVLAQDAIMNLAAVVIALSPLFLLRWPRALESGNAHGDLILDSLAVSAGLALGTPRQGQFAEAPGFEMGLEMGAPFLPRANGPWVRLRLNVASGRRQVDLEQAWGGGVMLWLDWQGFFFAGLLKSEGR